MTGVTAILLVGYLGRLRTNGISRVTGVTGMTGMTKVTGVVSEVCFSFAQNCTHEWDD